MKIEIKKHLITTYIKIQEYNISIKLGDFFLKENKKRT